MGNYIAPLFPWGAPLGVNMQCPAENMNCHLGPTRRTLCQTSRQDCVRYTTPPIEKASRETGGGLSE